MPHDDTPDPSPVKTCTKCGETKPVPEFTKGRARCKPCTATYMAAYRSENRARLATAAHDKYMANREKRLAWGRAYARSHPEKVRAQARSYYLAHRAEMIAKANARNASLSPAQRKAKSSKYYLAHRERAAQYQRDHYSNPDNAAARKATTNAWRAANPHKSKLYNSRHERRMREAPGSFTTDQLRLRFAMWGGNCWMCGRQANSVDHVIPISRGGTNWPANLRPACRPCNSRKHNKDWRCFVRRP